MGLIWQLQFLVLFLTFFIPLPVGMSFCFKNFAGFSIGVNNLRVWLSSRVHALNLGIRWWNRLSRLGFTLGFLLYCVNSGLVIWFAIRSIGIMGCHCVQNCTRVLCRTCFLVGPRTNSNSPSDNKCSRSAS